jgi:hypothetical protein
MKQTMKKIYEANHDKYLQQQYPGQNKIDSTFFHNCIQLLKIQIKQ